MDYLVEIKKNIYLLSFQIIALCKIYTLKICKQDNSKSIIGMSFKLARLIEDNE